MCPPIVSVSLATFLSLFLHTIGGQLESDSADSSATSDNSADDIYMEQYTKTIAHELKSMALQGGSSDNRCAADLTVARAWADIIFKDDLCPGYTFLLQEAMHSSMPDEVTKEVGGVSATLLPVPVTSRPGVSHFYKAAFAVTFKSATMPSKTTSDNSCTDLRMINQHIVDCVLPDVETIFSHQHRTAVFAMHVDSNELRLLRFDRSGVIVTDVIDYLDGAQGTREWLEILYGMSQLEEEDLGVDTTAIPLSRDSYGWKMMNMAAIAQPEDVDSWEGVVEDPTYIPGFLQNASAFVAPSPLFDESVLPQDPAMESDDLPDTLRDYIAPSFTHTRHAFLATLDEFSPRFSLTINRRHFLVGRPISLSDEMFGHATRGFIALEWETLRLVFFKDTWRIVSTEFGREGDVLQRLNEAKVKHVPTLVCHGDVPGQETLADQHVFLRTGEAGEGAKESRHRIRRHIHYRMVVAEVCLPLNLFRRGKQLVSIMRNCLKAHQQAYEKCRLIHGDISTGNVLICPTIVRKNEAVGVIWKGMLTDWEFARPIAAAGKDKGSTFDAMATTAFMSRHLLIHPRARDSIQIADELESVLHVMLYTAIRTLRHTHQDSTKDICNLFFDDCANLDKAQLTIHAKVVLMRRGEFRWNGRLLKFLDGDSKEAVKHPLTLLVTTMMRVFRARYVVNAWQAEQRRHKPEATGSIRDQPQKVKKPSKAEVELSVAAHSHKAMLAMFKDCLSGENHARLWPEHDRLDDSCEDTASETEENDESWSHGDVAGDEEGRDISKRPRDYSESVGDNLPGGDGHDDDAPACKRGRDL